MKKLTRLLLMLLVLVVSAGLTSCDLLFGEEDNPVDPTPTPTPTPPIYANDFERPLTFEAAQDNVKVTFMFSSDAKPDYKKVEYSLDKGATWTALSGPNQAILLEKKGDIVMFRGDNPTYNGDARFVITKAASQTRGVTVSDCLANVIGNIYSLLQKMNFAGETKLLDENTAAFKNLLKDNPIDAISDDGARRLVTSSRNLAPGVLEGFLSGTLITVAPELPAEELKESCYKETFANCPYLSKVTMLATKCADGLNPLDCLKDWLKNSGTNAEGGLNIGWNSSGKMQAGSLTLDDMINNSGLSADVLENTTITTINPETGEKTTEPYIKNPVTGITLNQEKFSLAIGDTYMLTATIAPENATRKDVSWSSSDTNVATVSTDGLVTAVAVGETTITVKTIYGGKTATCTVKVYNANSATIDVTMGEEDL